MATKLMRLPVPRWLALIALLAAPITGFAQLPSPASHFGHPMGEARTLIEWDDVVSYFKRLAVASDRVRVDELGRTTEGRPFILVTLAEPKALANLNRYKQIQEELADPRRTSTRAAEALIEQGKTVVLITCSIHSNEVASTHAAVEFVHKLLTEDTPRHRAIFRDTIFLLVPSLNPDGVDKVASWYKRYLGTPYEGGPMIELYQKYVGHDNNRDWYIFSQQETRLAIEKIHNVWRPQIVYDVHQMGSNGARMFVPPWRDPIDPNIDPLIVQQVNQIGTAMAADLTAAGKTGVVVNAIYDYFTPARHYQSYHGGLRLLRRGSERALRNVDRNTVLVVNNERAGLQCSGAGLELPRALAGRQVDVARHHRLPTDHLRDLPLPGCSAAPRSATKLPSYFAARYGPQPQSVIHSST